VDVLRGVLALYVVCTHARWLLWQGHAAFMAQPHAAWEKGLAYAAGGFKYGHLAVMVFFALSGFFIHLRMAQKFAKGERCPKMDTGDYLRRRAWRVLPVYYFALLFTLLLDLAGRSFYPTLYQAATPDEFTNGLFALKGYGPESVIPALLLLPRSLGFYFGSNGPLWSLGFEMVYYAIYPAWFVLRKKFGQRAYPMAFGVALAAAVLRTQMTVPFLDWFTEVVSLWSVWLAGAWLAEAILAGKISRPMVLAAGAGAGVAWAAHHLHLPGPAELPLLMVLGGGVTVVFGTLPAGFASFPLCRWVETMGQQSYTLYVCHFPVIALISARCFEVSGERPSHGLLALYGVAAAVLVGKLCFHICESHFVHPRIRLEDKPANKAPAAAAKVALLNVPE
jgi:peptidoglycan/LPS O-acetylase OafA/YrhL